MASVKRPRHNTHPRSMKSNHGEHTSIPSQNKNKYPPLFFSSIDFFLYIPLPSTSDNQGGFRATGAGEPSKIQSTRPTTFPHALDTIDQREGAVSGPSGRCRDESRGRKVINIHKGALISSQLTWVIGTQRAGSGAREPRHSLVHTGGGQKGGARAGPEERREAGGSVLRRLQQ